MHERRATALRRGSGSQVECPHFYTFARAGRITGHSDRTPHVSVTQPDNPAPCVCVSMPDAGCALYGHCLHVCALYAHRVAQ